MLLQSDNFKGTPSANIGTNFRYLWQAYEYVLRCKEKLVPLMHIYGVADAYLSVVRLYQESQQQALPLRWVTFSQGETPACTLQNVYNPIVTPEHAVPNSFVLGGSNVARHMMLTGPHGCGKTTSMKTIAYVYAMGQSILLGQADQAAILPINKIGTYLNITDNLAQGMSSFMAEKKRMKELHALAEHLEPTDRCLMLIDEPYAKTLQVVGEDRVYRFVADLYKIPQLMMLIATHFEKPAILESESQGVVENYQPELLEPTPHNFMRTFRILKGKAGWWFEDAQRRSDFVDWLGEVAT
jgi:DNA mismatch repair protein MutS